MKHEAALKEAIKKYALQNALFHKGKAQPGSVIGKILSDNPELKKDMKNIKKHVDAILKEVNGLSAKQQEAELTRIAPELLEKQEKKKEILRALNNVEPGKVVMRFEPSPSGPLHIGHAYPLMLNVEYCKLYQGKLILRISDTNPDNIDPTCYELLQRDFAWLTGDAGIKTEVVVQSDRMEVYYMHALRLIEEDHAYVCTCDPEEFRNMMATKTPCPCRDLGADEHVHRWKKMQDAKGFAQGDAVVRIKTDVNHKNPAMRDFPALRINESEHPRQGKKYRVWPLLNFAVAVDDHELGLTHVLRGKDHYDNTKRQEYIFKYSNWKFPEYIHIGRINFHGLRLSASETRQRINNHEFEGWDDIRLPFIGAMRRRGYTPYAFGKYALAVGVTMVDKSVEKDEFFKTLYSFNKEKIEASAKRQFFIQDPVEITIKDAPEQDIELDYHKEHMLGGRKMKTHERFFLCREDAERIKEGELIRLMDCLNFKKKGKSFVFDSLDYETFKKKGKMIIHWLPADGDNVQVTIFMPDGATVSGLGEHAIRTLKQDEVIQMERFGFVKLDDKEDDQFRFWFTHK